MEVQILEGLQSTPIGKPIGIEGAITDEGTLQVGILFLLMCVTRQILRVLFSVLLTIMRQ